MTALCYVRYVPWPYSWDFSSRGSELLKIWALVQARAETQGVKGREQRWCLWKGSQPHSHQLEGMGSTVSVNFPIEVKDGASTTKRFVTL